jgi:hypothetical protein
MNIYGLVAVAFVVLVFAAVGQQGFEDSIQEQEHYRSMVCAEVWPDYRGLELECPSTGPRLQ